jgi:hypothetical protein
MTAPKSMDLKNCTIIFRDGDSPKTTLEVKIDEGNIQWEVARNLEVKRDRGLLDYIKEGDEEPMTVNLECRFASLISSTGDPLTPYEFLTMTGAGDELVSTGQVCGASAIDIRVETDHDCQDVEDEIIDFLQFHYEKIGGSFKDGTLSVSGLCNTVLPVATKTTLA